MRFLVRTQLLLLHRFCNCITVILVVTFMQVIYIYIHETNRLCRERSAAAVLHVQFVLHAEICFVVLH